MSDIENLRTKLDAAIAQFQISNRSNQDNIHNVETLLTKHIEGLLKRYKKEISNNEKYLVAVKEEFFIRKIRVNMNKLQASIFSDLLNLKNIVVEKNKSNIDESIKRSKRIICLLLRAFGNFIDSEESYLAELNRIKSTSTLTYLSTESFSSNNMPISSIESTSLSPNEVTDSELKKDFDDEINKKNLQEKKSFEDKILEAKKYVQIEEQGHRLNLESIHGLKERIHLCFKKLALIKLKMTEELMDQYKNVASTKEVLENQKNDNQAKLDILSEKDRVSNLILRFHKNIDNITCNRENISGKQRIQNLLFEFQKIILQNKEQIIDYILGEIQFILGQGTLESDLRFLEKLEKQANDIDKFDTPRFFKLCVHIGIAKKYVNDIIYLKKKALLEKYYNLK